jgi:hydrogenase maturation protein HypF
MHGALTVAAPGQIIRVRGTVQGVGFRPTVWRIARDMGLSGQVLNDGQGVVIRLWSDSPERFIERLRREAPPLARIESIEIRPFDAASPGGPFEIVSSIAGGSETAIAADSATCADCLAESLDPQARRYGYAFSNCTNCGPRLSIIGAVPYDRGSTSMAEFAMCDDCAREYRDPADRRFHAQPIACPACGPRLWLEFRDGRRQEDDVIATAARLIRAGRIVAIKGIGGFHLACDATNEAAVVELRQRKGRDAKPFALMARDLNGISRFAVVSEEEAAALQSPEAPIVLLAKRDGGAAVAAGIAPGQETLGFMLAYSPLHHLLMRQLPVPIVLTSGNLTDEPQCTDNGDALRRLSAIADCFVMHDRGIVNRVDDSVVRFAGAAPIVLRRARGYAPTPVPLHESFREVRPVMATGADLKATVAFIRDGAGIVSQHVGDLATPLAREDYARVTDLYIDLHGVVPAIIASDLHPDFHATRMAERLAQRFSVPHVKVQHHHAHMAACMAENRIATDTAPVLGLILDGTGLGSDGTVWGGEFLLGSYRSFERVGHFKPVPLPGGDRAAREPWRNAYAHLASARGWESLQRDFGNVPAVTRLAAKRRPALDRIIASGAGSPMCSSAGRLFDAVAALLGICFEQQSYEGEAAILLEGLASRAGSGGEAYEISSQDGVLSWTALFEGILRDLGAGVDAAVVARRFHDSLAGALAREALRICASRNVERVALSGGCFNNALLLAGTTAKLRRGGADVLTHRMLPPGDGSVSLGQCAVAAAAG